MTFDSFLARIDASLQKGLPGEEAQYIMAPYGRKTRDAALSLDKNPRLSAVLALFFPDTVGDIRFALIKRKEYPGVHSGQISFPGGKKDKEDEGLKQTALRETKEEVGVSSQNIHLLSELTELYIPPSRYLVKPFIGYCEKTPLFTPEEKEVQMILQPKLTWLLDDANMKIGEFPSGIKGITVKAPFFQYEKHKIWGATAMILAEIKGLLVG